MDTEFELPEGFEIPQSYEVAEQRVRDLANYVWAELPELFSLEEDGEGEETVGIPRNRVIEVMQNIGEELRHSHVQGTSVLTAACVNIVQEVRPYIDPAVEEAIRPYSEEEENRSFTLDVLWTELYPVFDPQTVFGCVMQVAGLAVTGMLNSLIWEDPAWEVVSDILTENMVPLHPEFLGGVGFYVICSYLRVVRFREFPNIRCIVE